MSTNVEGAVTITQERLEQLERAEAMLNAMEEHGVDNWEGYDAAMRSYRGWLKERKEEQKTEAPK